MAAGLKFYAPLLFALYGLYGAIFCGLAKDFVYGLTFGVTKSVDWNIIARLW